MWLDVVTGMAWSAVGFYAGLLVGWDARAAAHPARHAYGRNGHHTHRRRRRSSHDDT